MSNWWYLVKFVYSCSNIILSSWLFSKISLDMSWTRLWWKAIMHDYIITSDDVSHSDSRACLIIMFNMTYCSSKLKWGVKLVTKKLDNFITSLIDWWRDFMFFDANLCNKFFKLYNWVRLLVEERNSIKFWRQIF